MLYYIRKIMDFDEIRQSPLSVYQKRKGNATVERQEKTGKIYFVLFALTIVFLSAVLCRAVTDQRLAVTSDYSVAVQREAEEAVIPERKLVNVNTASAEELEAITGIGPALAGAIVSYRDEHGAFETPEELMNVRGIGAGKLEAFRSEITLTDEEAEK